MEEVVVQKKRTGLTEEQVAKLMDCQNVQQFKLVSKELLLHNREFIKDILRIAPKAVHGMPGFPNLMHLLTEFKRNSKNLPKNLYIILINRTFRKANARPFLDPHIFR
jgi:hypothetical protein